MSYSPQQQHANPYAYDQIVANATVDERVTFIRRTYLHLAGAVLAFVAIETLIFTLFGDRVFAAVQGMFASNLSWLVVMIAFMAVSWIAERWANSDTSISMQYMGLSLFVVAEAIIFIPILAIASKFYPGAITSAAVVTALVFCGLTATVFISKADFSFLRMGLTIGGFAAIGLIGVSMFFQDFSLGIWFPALMVVLASGYILYYTSNVMRHYRTTQHVAAALALFSAVALLFWYVLQLFMSND